MSKRTDYRALSRSALVMRFAAIGAFAGLAAWALVFGLHFFFEADKPSISSLLWAMLRGALFAIVLALFLYAKWRRHDNPKK